MSLFTGKARRALAPLGVAAVVAIVVACGSWFNWFAALDQAWYDASLRMHQLDYPDDIVIVAIDESSLDRLGAWPWDRRYHAQLLSRLATADAVIFDLIFAESQSLAVNPAETPYLPSTTDLADSSAQNSQAPLSVPVSDPDAALAAAMRAHGGVVLPLYIEQQQYRGLMQEVLPIPALAGAAAALGHAHVEYASDGIARGVYLRMGLGKPYWPHLSLALGGFLNDVTLSDSAYSRPVGVAGSPYIIYPGHFKNLRFIGAANSVYRFSYVDVLDGLVPVDQLRGKRVFVGATAAGLGDDVPTPLGALPGVEFHANAYHALRSNGFITSMGDVAGVFLHVTVAWLACVLLSRLAPAYFLAGSALALLGWAALVTLLFFSASVWVEPTPFFVAVLLFYPLWSWRRIEIALRFLRSELKQLEGSPRSAEPDVALVQAQLAEQVSIGALHAASIMPIARSAGKPLWPIYSFATGRVSSAFELGDKCYQIELSAHAPDSVGGWSAVSQGSGLRKFGGDEALPEREQAALNILACLMDDSLVSQASLADDSYELVERTIEEIYATRSVVERTRERMNQSMARLQDIVVVSDIAGKIIFINDVGSEHFKPGLVGATIFSLQAYLGSVVWPGLLRELMVEGKPLYQELETTGGQMLLCQAATLHETIASRDTLLFVFTDVTQLRALEQSKNEALAFLSHDMRSPLVSQLALIEKFQLSSPDAASAQMPLLKKLVYFAERSLKYSEDFLQLSRAENLDQQAFQLVDMHGVVDGAYSQVTGLALNHDVAIEIKRAAADCWMQGDAQLLERAVTNLLSNAIQHSEAGSKVVLSLQAGDELRVAIADRGRGIEAGVIPHLFEPYFRARQKAGGAAVERDANASEEAGPGARNYGLGLSFVHSVVERHGGRIEVKSVLGRGTIFTLHFQKTELE